MGMHGCPQGGVHLCAGVFAVVGDGVRGGLAAQVLLEVDETCTCALHQPEGTSTQRQCE